MRTVRFFALFVGLCCLASASMITINFTDQTTGAKPNGYQIGPVVFNDTVGANLNVNDYGVQSFGKALAVFPDNDASKLQMKFDTNMDFISFWFGNDDPNWTNPGDTAVLNLYYFGNLVGTTTAIMNRNDLMDQVIGLNLGPFGLFFNEAVFYYNVVNGPQGNNGLIEIVDDITLNAVPEPATYLLLATALGLGGLLRRRRA